MKISTFERIEEELTMKISELQTKLQTSTSVERIAKEECISIRTKLSEIESELSTANHMGQMLQMQLQQQKTESQISERDLTRKINELNDIIRKDKEVIKEKEKQIDSLQQELDLEKSASNLARGPIETLQSNPNEKNYSQETNISVTSPRTESNSPTLSLGKMSVSESMGSSFWSQDEPFEIAQVPRYTNMFEMQMLQSNLKQREGEVQQLQWELNRREQERALLNTEISTLLTKIEELEAKINDYDNLKTQFSEIQQQYDTLCQLYGEKSRGK
ncbi:hypothetical protein NQ318_017342 [Aromia moschata]|uniref:TATA element modulatory factor 1 TATA binding domain-containing protein n=1 Tax=Aromia moschata TaxID=1265417 RepID=A0AAV8XAL5_9CUCU|nr:hypothetical protein NQ318_017342 [Aromia moschata]